MGLEHIQGDVQTAENSSNLCQATVLIKLPSQNKMVIVLVMKMPSPFGKRPE